MRISPLTTYNYNQANHQTKSSFSTISFKNNLDFAKKVLIDSKTGKVNETIKNLLERLFQLEKILGDKFEVETGRNNADLISFINTLKNPKGEFVKENVNCAKKLLNYYMFPKKYGNYIDFYNIRMLLSFCKNDDGIFDKELFENVFKLAKKDEYDNFILRNIATLFACSIEEKKELMKLFAQVSPDKHLNGNFYILARFCVDEDYKINQENVEFVKKLSKLPKANYSKYFLDLANKHPNQHEYLLELAKNPNFSKNVNYIHDFLFYMENENEEISCADKERLSLYLSKNNNLDNFSILFAKCCVYQNEKRIDFNDDLFNKTLDIISVLEHENFSLFNAGTIADLIENRVDVDHLSFNEKNNLLKNIKKMQSKLNDSSVFSDVANKLQESINPNIKPLEVSEESKFNFIKEILSSKEDNYTPFEKTLVDTIAKLEDMQGGLALKYSRHEFMADLVKITESEFEKYCTKLNIAPVNESSYNGIIQLQNLDLNNPKDKEVYNLAYKFMYENSFEMNDEELDEFLNILIKAMPEFINVVDKKQHTNQNHTLDVHILLALAYALKNPNYFEKLNSKDRAVLKFAILFHDLSKEEGVVDSTHPQVSANWVYGISSKIFKTQDMQNRVYEFVNNHHWTKEFNVANKSKVINELAFKFRRPNDFEMAKIMADADMKAVGEHIYRAYGGCLADDGIKKIEDSINFYNSNGSVVNPHSIVNPKKLKNHIIEYNGKRFPLINLAILDNEALVDEFGFSYGLKKKDLRFLVHMVHDGDVLSDLDTLKLLNSPINGGVLSESLIGLNKIKTYGNRKYGVLLSTSNYDVVGMSKFSIGSGTKKDFNSIIYLAFDSMSDVDKGDFRDKFLQHLGKKYSNITNKDYSIFYQKYLSNLATLSQINPKENYKLGRYKISGKLLIEAIKTTIDDYSINNNSANSEIISYLPKLNAVVARANSIENVSNEVIDFAHENNLPVILI